MNNSGLTYLKSLMVDENHDIKTRLNELENFIAILIDITNKLNESKVKFEAWKQYFEVLLIKFTLHSSSLIHLIKGTPLIINNKHVTYPDLGSISLIARAQLENYLMFYNLNILPKSDVEGEFSFLLFELSGLTNRQGYKSGTKYIDKKLHEKEQIEDLIYKIELNDFFKQLSNEDKKKIKSKKVPAKLIGWESLIEKSNLNTENFILLWKLYSNYAHSEMISAIQMKDYFNNRKELDKTIYTILRQAIMLVCVIIIDLKQLFGITQIILNTYSTDDINKIEMWNRLAIKNDGM